MADLGEQFDVTNEPAMNQYQPLPAGNYKVVARSSEWKPTSTGGKMLVFEWQVIDGPYAGKTLRSRLNLQNSNPTAVQIARSELATIGTACGLVKLTDSAQTHDIPIILEVAIETRKDNGEPTNKIKNYHNIKAYSQANTATSTTTAAKPAWA